MITKEEFNKLNDDWDKQISLHEKRNEKQQVEINHLKGQVFVLTERLKQIETICKSSKEFDDNGFIVDYKEPSEGNAYFMTKEDREKIKKGIL